MSPQGTGALVYWHCGGTIESRSGHLDFDIAHRLLELFAAEEAAARQWEDAAAAAFCARMRLDLGAALAAADVWRIAATAGGESSCVR